MPSFHDKVNKSFYFKCLLKYTSSDLLGTNIQLINKSLLNHFDTTNFFGFLVGNTFLFARSFRLEEKKTNQRCLTR